MNIEYVIRLPRDAGWEFDEFWDSKEISKIIEIEKMPFKSRKRLNTLQRPFHPFKIRLVKVILDNGEIEVLATSLLDEEKYPTHIFKELYCKRWGIETNYSRPKNHIEISNFTGYSTQSILQDFYANAFIANIQRILIRDAQYALKRAQKIVNTNTKSTETLSLGYMEKSSSRDTHKQQPQISPRISTTIPNRTSTHQKGKNIPQKKTPMETKVLPQPKEGVMRMNAPNLTTLGCSLRERRPLVDNVESFEGAARGPRPLTAASRIRTSYFFIARISKKYCSCDSFLSHARLRPLSGLSRAIQIPLFERTTRDSPCDHLMSFLEQLVIVPTKDSCPPWAVLISPPRSASALAAFFEADSTNSEPKISDAPLKGARNGSKMPGKLGLACSLFLLFFSLNAREFLTGLYQILAQIVA